MSYLSSLYRPKSSSDVMDFIYGIGQPTLWKRDYEKLYAKHVEIQRQNERLRERNEQLANFITILIDPKREKEDVEDEKEDVKEEKEDVEEEKDKEIKGKEEKQYTTSELNAKILTLEKCFIELQKRGAKLYTTTE